jgi:hypothetical protein
MYAAAEKSVKSEVTVVFERQRDALEHAGRKFRAEKPRGRRKTRNRPLSTHHSLVLGLEDLDLEPLWRKMGEL